MSAEQQLREAFENPDEYGFIRRELLAAVGRLLDPIPDDLFSGIEWVKRFSAKEAMEAYQAWLIGGDE